MIDQLYFPCLLLVFKNVLTLTGLSCPPPSLYTSVAASTCNDSSEYHCLYNGKSKLYESFCFEAEQFPAGGLNSQACSEYRYQPASYYSNQYYSRCMYSKSRCTEEGQVVHDDSFTEKDTTCRCDYTQGYDFVTKPKERCYCKPTEEDCSCYKRRCPENTTLTPDYQCLKTVGLITCPVIKHKGDETDITVFVTKQEDSNSELSTLSYKSGFGRLFISGVIAVVMVFLLFGSIVVILIQDEVEEHETRDLENVSITTDETIKFHDAPITEDETESEAEKIITRNGFQKSVKILGKHRKVVIKGRYGTGKSFMANQIAQRFSNYEPLFIQKVDLFVNAVPTEKNHIIIFDEVCDMYEDTKGRSKIIQVIEKYAQVKTNLVIITAGEYNNAFIDSLRKMAFAVDDNIIDLDIEFALSKEEKRSMLTYHLKLFESEHEVRSGWNASLLSDEVKEVIVSTDTFHGFPLLCKTFCSDLKNIKLGSKYFRQPPKELFEEIERIRVCSTKEASSKIQYSVLVYILLNKEGCIDVNHINSELMCKVGGLMFGFKFKEKDLIQYLDMKDICLLRFLQHQGAGKYSMHPTVYQAVLLSFSLLKYNKQVVERCKLEHILDLFRMPDYEPQPNEKIIVMSKNDEVEEFCELIATRMVKASFADESIVQMVCQYIIKSSTVSLSNRFFFRLEEDIKSYITSKRVHIMLIVFKEFVKESKSSFMTKNYFLTAWSILVCCKYEQYSAMSELLDAPIISATKTCLIAMLGTVVDEYDNNLLTYCSLWWTTNIDHPLVKAVSGLFSQKMKVFSTAHLFKRTKEGVSPIMFAAYFGRYQFLQRFLPQQEKDAKGTLLSKAAFHTLRNETADELIELSKKGKDRLLSDNIKYNTEICPKLEFGTVDDFQKTYNILEKFKRQLMKEHAE